ncbi:aldo/keto reductase [Bailinhaonella thermotolerans]|uniref:Aldo/keto reductase n=1 Tax=Bailinhaonella thermotolerans TaxID=1070861 RepID=A0A3A4A9D1_9ACTN|nr:aldo/keto reductase [Bailinhaonella thermotolerans]
METRRLGSTDVEVSTLSFGAAPLGNLFAPMSDDQAGASVRRALAGGVRYFDTAPHYGAGLSERRLGAALRAADRGSYTLSTKVGRLLRPLAPGEENDAPMFRDSPPYKRVWDFGRAGVRASIEESLERLGLDRVDVVYLHDPDVAGAEEAVYESAYPALAELREQGVVGAIGAGTNETELLTRFVRRLDLDVVLCAGRYSLLDRRAAEELLPACSERGTSVVIGGVYNSGLLADPRPGATYDYLPAPEPLVERALRMKALCETYGVPLRAAAIAFPLRHPAVASVLVGCRSEAEVADNLAMFAAEVPDALWAELEVA